MRLGICAGVESMERAARMGFDYIECALNSIALMPEQAFAALAARVGDFPLPMAACNCFLPGDIRVTGDQASAELQRAYLDVALSRAAALNVKTVVFGSGGARNVPDGYPFDKAWRQIADFLRLAGDTGDTYGIDIAIEPLRRQESNILNLVSEATAIAALVAHKRVGVLGDTYHMACACEPLDSLTRAGALLRHVHVSRPLPDGSARVYPSVGDGEDYAALADTLKAMDYRGDISVEAATEDMEKDGVSAVRCLKALLT